ncbi:rRNA maturation RNase YbeY [Oxobacter pfennigii]|nr:rRNA maturation RNase YbeY [Oxobacter pfennigii]
MADNRQSQFEAEPIEKLIKKVAKKAIEYEGVNSNPQISVILVDNKEIKEINRVYRKIDSATDVLSFPQIDYPADLENKENIDPDTGELVLGDIAISLERAYEQSKEYNHTFEREVAFLTVHGVLHLLGYDHETEEERNIMRVKEEEILGMLGITR